MKLEHESPETLKKEILNVIGTHLPLDRHKVFFFGSRVKGDSFERSDIDLGIEGPEPLPGAIKEEIQEALEELPLLYRIDIVDFQGVSPRFHEEAKKHIEPLN